MGKHLNFTFIIFTLFLFRSRVLCVDDISESESSSNGSSQCSSLQENCMPPSTEPSASPLVYSTSNDQTDQQISPDFCSEITECSQLPAECLECNFNYSCQYGTITNVTCRPSLTSSSCLGTRNFTRSFVCQFCYQTSKSKHSCVQKSNCQSSRDPRDLYTTNCTVHSDVLCLGSRLFSKNVECNWTSGYKWTTTMLLSITLGGFGADRFYLGHWQEGIGKLFSFGGLGVWTLVDAVLIAVGYLKPADGSLYI